jgi:hypothetical protein
MPINPFLPKQQVFDPELIHAMSVAFVQACTTLGLTVRTDPMNELVARKIIEGAQSGLRTEMALYLHAMQELPPATLEQVRASDPL